MPREVTRAVVNVYGPDGEFVAAGDTIPDTWDRDFVLSLLATGGATSGLAPDVEENP